MKESAAPWWERRWTLAALIVLSAVPLLWPDVPPLTDLPGHLGRYKIALDLHRSPALQQFYDFHWSLIPNLGVDLLMVPLGRLFGIEAAARIVVILIPPLTFAGFLWTMKEAHGRLTPAYLFAAPLIYSYTFLYGFLNFSLAVAFAFLAFALWLRLGRLHRFRLRAVLFVPLSLLLWVTHVFGWGMLGLMAFAAEAVREHDRRGLTWRAGAAAAWHCLPLAAPLPLMLGGQAPASAGDWFNVKWKVAAIITVFRDRWLVLDVFSAALMLLLVFMGLRDRRLSFSPTLAAAALMLLAAFILLPRLLLGGAHADNRLAPYFLALAVLALRPSEDSPRFTQWLALAGLAFFTVRIAAATVSAALYDRSFDAQLAALDRIPHGSRVITFVGMRCDGIWAVPRLEHLPGLLIVRREAFSNDQWTIAGSHLLSVKAPYRRYVDPSQMVSQACEGVSVEAAIASSRLEQFDFVWLIAPPRYDPAVTRGWREVWRSGSSVLFQLRAPPPPPNGGAITVS